MPTLQAVVVLTTFIATIIVITTAQLEDMGEEDVLVIEFMKNHRIPGVNPELEYAMLTEREEKMIYKANVTLNMGSPSPEATICSWVLLTHRQYSDTLLALSAEDGSSDKFYYMILAVYASNISVQSSSCTISYEAFVELNKWMHFCVTLSSDITMFVDGILQQGSNNCPFEGTEVITTTNGEIVLGANPLAKMPMSGKLADVRLYLSSLNSSTVNAIRSFTASDDDFIPIISIPGEFQKIPDGIEVGAVHRNKIKTTPSVRIWIHVPEELTYQEAADVCVRFGGDLIDAPEGNNTHDIKDYVIEVLTQVMINFWVKSSAGSCMATTVSPSAITTDRKVCSTLLHGICSVPRSTKYSLIGFTQHPMRLTLFENQYTFAAEYYYKLEFDKLRYKFLLEVGVKGEVLAHTAYSDVKTLMGRYKWINMETVEKNLPITLTLTACGPDQFTCTSGHCIDLVKVCDFKTDCHDFSDEQLCNTTQKRPVYYDYKLSGGNKLKVGLNATLLRILSVNMEEDTVEVKLRIVAEWRDYRVVFHNLHPGVMTLISHGDNEFYWQPNIVLKGVVSSDTMSLSMAHESGKMFVTAQRPGEPATFYSQEVLEHSGANVRITHHKEEFVTLLCPLELYIYPFDVQTCRVRLTLKGLKLDDAEWLPSSVEVRTRPGITLHLFKFLYFKKIVLNQTGNPVELELRLVRFYGSHLLVTFLPCVVLLAIGLSVFAIPVGDLSNRLTVSISCLIVMAALFVQISSTLPVSAEPKTIDFWMFMHVFFMALVFFAQLVLQHVYLSCLEGNRRSNTVSPLKDVMIWFTKKNEQKEDEEDMDDEADVMSHSRRVNKWTAIALVFVYSLFLVIFFIYVTVRRASLISQE